MIPEQTIGRKIEPRQDDEIAESIKTTMKALNDYFSVKGASKQARLRAVGSEFGHMVARNISSSNDPDTVLAEIATFWNSYALGEMEMKKGNPTTFTLRNCYDCLGVDSTDLLCGFKEGFVNAIINDRTGGMGSVEEVECCAMGHDNCVFQVKTVHHEMTETASTSVRG